MVCAHLLFHSHPPPPSAGCAVTSPGSSSATVFVQLLLLFGILLVFTFAVLIAISPRFYLSSGFAKLNRSTIHHLQSELRKIQAEQRRVLVDLGVIPKERAFNADEVRLLSPPSRERKLARNRSKKRGNESHLHSSPSPQVVTSKMRHEYEQRLMSPVTRR